MNKILYILPLPKSENNINMQNLKKYPKIYQRINTIKNMSHLINQNYQQINTQNIVLLQYNYTLIQQYKQKYTIIQRDYQILATQSSIWMLGSLGVYIGHSMLQVFYRKMQSQKLLCIQIISSISKYEHKILQYLEHCKIGGFGGGPYQFEHLAPTYSSLLTLFILASPASLGMIDRKGLEKFFWSIQDTKEKGSYLMHVNGEADMRAVYIVVIMVVILKLDPKLLDGCAEYIASCQTYEGGIGAVRYSEAHGGYAFCGYAALVCMGKAHYIDQEKLLNWLVNRQMENEGGFNGRTNKVVDACYSFWQGAIFNLLMLSGYLNDQLMNVFELQTYIHMCQNPTGGIFDKPSKSPDTYHTSYGLSGYSLADSQFQNPIYNVPNKCIDFVKQFFQ